jgi:hypothetical protein
MVKALNKIFFYVASGRATIGHRCKFIQSKTEGHPSRLCPLLSIVLTTSLYTIFYK